MKAAALVQAYAASLVTFILLDLTWLGLIARGFYRERLGHLLGPDVRWTPVVLFYLLYVAAVFVFAVVPAAERGAPARALWLGGFFGLAAYATYDLVNLATLRGFPAVVAVVDIAWGTLLTATVAAVGYFVGVRA